MAREPRADPRVVGGRYRSGYWGAEYTVLVVALTGATTWWRVKWEDGHTTEHATPWDWRRDRVIYAPAPTS